MSTTFAGERQLFLPVQGQQRSPTHHLAGLGYVGPRGGLIRTGQRRSAEGAEAPPKSRSTRLSGAHGSSQRRPDHRVASVAAFGCPRRFARSVR